MAASNSVEQACVAPRLTAASETHSAPNQVHAARSCDKRTDQLIPAIDHWISDPLELTELGIEKFKSS